MLSTRGGAVVSHVDDEIMGRADTPSVNDPGHPALGLKRQGTANRQL
jgi:hypothetical protein